MERTRDSQRSKVYRMGHRVPEQQLASLDECQALVVAAHEAFGLTWSGKVVEGRHGKAATFTAWTNTISLPRWAWTKRVVLHEVAHSIVLRRISGGDRTGIAVHGPEFVRVMLELWDRFKVIRIAEARKHCRDLKVRVSTSEACKPLSVGGAKQISTLRAERRNLTKRLAEVDAQLKTLTAK